MRFNHALRTCLLMLALNLTLIPSVYAQQTYNLVEKSAVGDVAQIEDEMSMNLTITNAAAGAVPFTMHTTSQETKKFLQSLLSKDAKGKADGLRRVYTVYREVKNMGNGEQIVPSSLQGKTVIIRRKGKEVVGTDPAGVVFKGVQGALQDAFEDPFDLLPGHAVAIGEEWKGDAHNLGQPANLQLFKNITLKVQLADIATYEGHRCAHLRVTMHMEMPMTDELAMHINVAGDGYLALDIERMLGLDLSGPVAFKSIKAGGAVPTQSGEGTAHFKFTQHWLKVAGKPIAANPPEAK